MFDISPAVGAKVAVALQPTPHSHWRRRKKKRTKKQEPMKVNTWFINCCILGSIGGEGASVLGFKR
jgi:hypothetical protein